MPVVAQVLSQERRDTWSPWPRQPHPEGQHLARSFRLTHAKAPLILVTGQILPMGAGEELTSCLSVSLAMISLWSMRDSSSTSSSDCADSGASGDLGALGGKRSVLQVPSRPWLHAARRLRQCCPGHGGRRSEPHP